MLKHYRVATLLSTAFLALTAFHPRVREHATNNLCWKKLMHWHHNHAPWSKSSCAKCIANGEDYCISTNTCIPRATFGCHGPEDHITGDKHFALHGNPHAQHSMVCPEKSETEEDITFHLRRPCRMMKHVCAETKDSRKCQELQDACASMKEDSCDSIEDKCNEKSWWPFHHHHCNKWKRTCTKADPCAEAKNCDKFDGRCLYLKRKCEHKKHEDLDDVLTTPWTKSKTSESFRTKFLEKHITSSSEKMGVEKPVDCYFDPICHGHVDWDKVAVIKEWFFKEVKVEPTSAYQKTQKVLLDARIPTDRVSVTLDKWYEDGTGNVIPVEIAKLAAVIQV